MIRFYKHIIIHGHYYNLYPYIYISIISYVISISTILWTHISRHVMIVHKIFFAQGHAKSWWWLGENAMVNNQSSLNLSGLTRGIVYMPYMSGLSFFHICSLTRHQTLHGFFLKILQDPPWWFSINPLDEHWSGDCFYVDDKVGAPVEEIAKLMQITPITMWFMVRK